MSFFNSILSKLGMGTAEAAELPAATTAAAPAATTLGVAGAAAVTAMSSVDVVGKLTALAAAHAEPSNWQTSIVDLLKLLGMDSSITARKAMAVELACPADKMSDSAHMNMWLHQAVLQKLAANGGNIPKDLLH
jgi:Domain of unknown function (DUF3597)